MKSYTIVSYAYKADIWCGDCVVEEVCKDRNIENPEQWDAEQSLDIIAENISWSEIMSQNFDRYDEYSFDSDEFPKVIFADQIEEDEYCCKCHEKVI